MTPRSPVFVDSVHLIGEFLEGDQWHAAAMAASEDTHTRQKVTSEGVFQEFLAHVSRAGSENRADAAAIVREIRMASRFAVISHTSELLEAALDLFDGEFRYTRLSYQDCIAIQIMRDFGISEILTADQEFAIAGVTPLLRRYI